MIARWRTPPVVVAPPGISLVEKASNNEKKQWKYMSFQSQYITFGDFYKGQKGGDIMERVALYARVSTDEQVKHGLSLSEQVRTLTDYAHDHGMKIVDTYTDEGISARKRYTKRPAMMRMLDDVKADKIDRILFVRLDRWFRSVGDYYEVQSILDAHKVTWQATQDDYETVTASGRFKVNIMLSVAQDEADRTSERIRFVFDGKRERNETTGGGVPKGYLVENKHVKVDPLLAPIVQKAFQIYIATGSIMKVTEECPELKIQSYNTGMRFIRNRAYIGEFAGIHIPPLISQDDFDRAQQTKGHTVRKTKENRVYLFSGMLYCPKCGKRMNGRYVSRMSKRDGKLHEFYFYRCSGQYTGCHHCKGFREPDLESYLLSHIDGKVSYMVESQKSQKTVSYKSQRDAIKRKMEKLSDLYLSDEIEKSDYVKKYDDLKMQLDAVPPDVMPMDTGKIQQTFFPSWQDAYRQLTKADQQIFWRQTIDHIVLDDDGIRDFSLR